MAAAQLSRVRQLSRRAQRSSVLRAARPLLLWQGAALLLPVEAAQLPAVARALRVQPVADRLVPGLPALLGVDHQARPVEALAKGPGPPVVPDLLPLVTGDLVAVLRVLPRAALLLPIATRALILLAVTVVPVNPGLAVQPVALNLPGLMAVALLRVVPRAVALRVAVLLLVVLLLVVLRREDRPVVVRVLRLLPGLRLPVGDLIPLVAGPAVALSVPADLVVLA